MQKIIINYNGMQVVVEVEESGYISHESQHVLETVFPGSTARPGGYLPSVAIPWISKHFDVKVDQTNDAPKE